MSTKIFCQLNDNFFQDAEIPLADEFALFKRLCDVLYERRSFDQLQRVTFSAMGSPYFNKKPDLMKVIRLAAITFQAHTVLFVSSRWYK